MRLVIGLRSYLVNQIHHIADRVFSTIVPAMFFPLFILALVSPTFAQIGDPDPEFLTGTGFNNSVKAVHMLPNGKMYVVGYFTSYKGEEHRHIVKLNADGTVDTSFQPNVDGSIDNSFKSVGDHVNAANGNIETIAVQADGKIIIGGSFTEYNGYKRNRIARLNTDGSLDLTFSAGLGIPDAELGFDGLVTKILITSDNKILVSGFFQKYNRSNRQRIARLLTSGAVDPTFDTSQGANSNIYSMALQSDGKVIIGGFFTQFAGTNRSKLARLNTSGTLDLSFNIGSGINDAGFVRDIAIRPSDSKIYIVGSFSSYNGITRNNIALLNTNGSLDANMYSNSQGTDGVISMAKILGQRLFIGGEFNTFRGNEVSGLAVINVQTGNFDVLYPHRSGFNNEVFDVATYNSHYVYVGRFTRYLNVNHNRIVRVLMTNFPPTVTSIEPNQFSNESSREITFDINGTNLLPTSTVSISGTGISIQNVAQLSRVKLRVTARIVVGASVGFRSITVRNPTPGGGSFQVSLGLRVVYPKPTLTSITPATLPIGSTNRTLTIIGTNFNPQTELFIDSDGIEIISSTYVSSTQLLAKVNVASQASTGIVATTVRNLSTFGGGGFSNALNITLENPVPSITSITPAEAGQGQTQIVTINGTNFLRNSKVIVNGVGVSTNGISFISSTQLKAQLSINQNAVVGVRTLVVTNPTPGGGTSNATNFTVNLNYPVPTLSTMTPNVVNQGQSVLVKFTGTNILPETTVRFNIQGVTVTDLNRESSTVLWAKINAASTASTGSHLMWLLNPQPGGGGSESVVLTILGPLNPVPTITSITPNTFALGSTSTVTITGTNFIQNSTLTIEGDGISSSDVSVLSDTQIQAKFSVAGNAAAGNKSIRISNPTPGGGFSNASTVVVEPNRVPSLDAIPDIEFLHSAPLQTIQLSGIGPGIGESSQNVTVTAIADDPDLIPTLSVEYTNPETVGQLKIQNDRRRVGSTFIRVKVKDNGGTSNGGIDELIRVVKVTVNLDSNLENDLEKPLSYLLAQNYPNPFNPSTTLQFTMASSGHVRLQVFNAMGVIIDTLVDEVRPAGVHHVPYDASHLSSGIYIYRIQTDSGFIQSRKMTLIK